MFFEEGVQDEEIKAIKTNDTWELTTLLEEKNL